MTDMTFAEILMHGNIGISVLLTIIYLTLVGLIYWLTKQYVRATNNISKTLNGINKTIRKLDKTIALNGQNTKKNIQLTEKVFDILVNNKLGK